MPQTMRRIEVLGSQMAYVDEGPRNAPVVLFSCTATRRPPTCGATSSPTSHRPLAASPRT
jgi:hypothetical protein